jgi:hypothetical protein
MSEKLSDLVKQIEFKAEQGKALRKSPWDNTSSNWRVTLKYQKRTVALDFYAGSLVKDISVGDVVSCMVSDSSVARNGYSEFLSEFGYEDTAKHRKTFDGCEKQLEKLQHLLGDDFDQFMEADNDV